MKHLVCVAIMVFAGCSGTKDTVSDVDMSEIKDEAVTNENEEISDINDFAEINEPDEESVETDEEISDYPENEAEDDPTDEFDETVDEDVIEEVMFPECLTYSNPVSTKVLKDADLMEISGIAVSYQNPGILWVHNDSGGKATLFAIRFDGAIAAKLVLEGAVNIDWEALSLNPCGKDECLFIGDTGDNSLNRNDYSIIVVKEPFIPQDSSGLEINDDTWVKIPISYEGVPHQNSEAMAIDNNGAVYIFSKEISLTNVFKAEFLEESGTEFKFIGSINTGAKVPGYPDIAQPSLVTAADINRNGTRLLLRTYGIYTTDNDGIREYLFSKGNVEEIFSNTPFFVPEGRDMQGEAIGYDPFTGGYVHVSEYYKQVIDFDPNIWVINCGN